MMKFTRRLLIKKIIPFSIISFFCKSSIASDESKDVNIDGVKDGNRTLPPKIHSKMHASSIITDINIDLQSFLNNGVITPNMFYTSESSDWSHAFSQAAQIAFRLSLPVTLLPITYTFHSSLDLSIFKFGFVCASNRNNKTILKALFNDNNETVFVSLKNVDRRKTGGFTIDANGLYDVAFDTSWTITGGPSLMMVWEKIQIQGWRKIGWVANNNNDVWNKNITMLNDFESNDDSISYFNHSPGGPVSFEGCSFSGGRIKITAQHVSAIFCVFRGVEIKEGGSSWNVFSANGCHFFKDKRFNACFIISGAIQGFTVVGGLIEPTDGGTVILGLGKHATLNCGMLNFQGVRISSYNKKSPAILASGHLKNNYGESAINISGGMVELSTFDVNCLSWVDVLVLDSVLINNNPPRIVSRTITKKSWSYSSPCAEKIIIPSFNSTKCIVNNLIRNLSTSGSVFGSFDLLSKNKTKNSRGVLKFLYSDDGGYAEFSYRSDEKETKFSLIDCYYESPERTINIEVNRDEVIISNDRNLSSDDVDDVWDVMVCFSGYLDYLPE